jgi:hypothetical protein
MTKIGAYVTARLTSSLNPPELHIRSPLIYLMGIAFVLIVTLALMEPASSAGLTMFSRTVFFSLHLFPATIIAWLLSGWLFNLRLSRSISPWPLLVIAGAITGLLLAPISVTLEIFFGVFDASDPQSKRLSFTVADWLNELKDEVRDVPLTTAIIWPAMNAFIVWRFGGARDEITTTSTNELKLGRSDLSSKAVLMPRDTAKTNDAKWVVLDPAAPQKYNKLSSPSLLDRLPVRIGRDIVFLEAQEHYLRVVTCRGEHLLLQGFSHAIAELEKHGFDGVQIHRSTWVVWKHVGSIESRSGAMFVNLSTGIALQIGRRRAKSVTATWRQRLM